MTLNIPIITLFLVFLLIAVRQIGGFRLQIWQIMAGGAAVVLLTGQISPGEALRAVNADVMLFLFGMFVIGQALEQSGYLAHLSYRYFKRAHTTSSLLWFIILGMGCASAFLMNDTLAIIGTPVVLLLAKKHDMPPSVLLLALAFSITLGSVTSPIGNPQNLLIAVNGVTGDPFTTFLVWLLVPTAVNLVLTHVLLRLLYHEEFHEEPLNHSQEPIRDRTLAFLSKISLQMVLILVGLKVLTVAAGLDIQFRLTYIAIASALPVLAGSTRRWALLKKVDWQTLLFFAAMFVLMEGVWRSGFFQSLLARSDLPLTSTVMITSVSVILSQFISNVPLVALYQPLLLHLGVSVKGLMALAAGSTVAGNLFILGAASNVIIIHTAERRSHATITFLQFARAGIPLTLVNIAVYLLYFALL